MQAQTTRARVKVELSKTCKGKPRNAPVWVLRYQLPSGKDSRKVLGPAWRKKGRPPRGYLTEGEAHVRAEAFVAARSPSATDGRRTFSAAHTAFLRYCAEERGLRGSTLHEYAKIGERLAARLGRGTRRWADRPLDTFAPEELLAVRRALVDSGRSADTLNHYRRVIRGIFGTHPTSPALVWAW